MAPTNSLVKCYAVLDDVRLAGPPELLADCVARLQSQLEPSQLTLNPSKSERFWFHTSALPSSLLDLQFRLVNKAAIVLGAPVGVDDSSINDLLVKDTHNYHERFFNTLLSPLLHHQEVFLLLRYCMLPKLTHLMRTVRPHWLHTTTQQFDQLIINIINQRLSIPNSSTPNLPYQTILSLPIRLGGFGLRSTTTTSPFAYWSSIAACMSTIQQRPQPISSTLVASSNSSNLTPQLLSSLQFCHRHHPESNESNEHPSDSKQPIDNINTVDNKDKIIHQLHQNYNDTPHHLQHLLTITHDNAQHQHFISNATPILKAILHSTANSPPSSAFLTTFPTEPRYEINDIAFIQAARLRLGLSPHPPLDDIQQCSCGKEIIDPWHFLSCTHLKRTAITNRHNVIVNLIASFVRDCGGIALVEPAALSKQSSKHPDIDIVIGTRHIYVDVTIRHPLAPSKLHSASTHPNSILQSAERDKHKKYDTLAHQNHASFIPFVVDTFGHITETSLQLLHDIIDSSPSPPNHTQTLTQYYTIIAYIAIAIVHSNSFIISTGTQQCRIGRRLRFSSVSSTHLSSSPPTSSHNPSLISFPCT